MTTQPDIRYQAVLPGPPFARPTWLRPNLGCNGAMAGALPLAGGWRHFDTVDIVQRDDDGGYVALRASIDDMLALADDRNQASALMDSLSAKRSDFAGLDMSHPHIMGIVNATPDSFSDGGRHNAPAAAIAAGRAMTEAGASIIDIGGESTRPGAEPVTRNQELARILPPITGLRAGTAVISVDTRHGDIMKRAVTAGAGIINDVDGLRGDGAMDAAAIANCPVIMMHMQGTPETMQQNPHYGFAPVEIYEFLAERVAAALAAGIPRDKIAIDPGFGFGKTVTHNLQLMNWTGLFHGLGVPVLIGASRKSSIAKISNDEPADARVPGSVVLAQKGVEQGAQMLRVHDVAETAQAIAVGMALHNAD